MKRAMKLAEALEVIRSHGRGKDTELAHVMPREKALLKALGGKGTRNPKTGLLEFEVDGGGGDSGGGNDSGGGGEGGQAGDFGGGYGDFGSANERTQDTPSAPQDTSGFGSGGYSAPSPPDLGLPGFGEMPAAPPSAPQTPDTAEAPVAFAPTSPPVAAESIIAALTPSAPPTPDFETIAAPVASPTPAPAPAPSPVDLGLPSFAPELPVSTPEIAAPPVSVAAPVASAPPQQDLVQAIIEALTPAPPTPDFETIAAPTAPLAPQDVMAGGEIERQELPAPTFDERLEAILQDLATPTTPSAPVFAGPEELGLPGFGAIPASPPPTPFAPPAPNFETIASPAVPTAPPTPDFETISTPAPPAAQPNLGEQIATAIGGFVNSMNQPPPVYTTPGLLYAAAEAIGNALASAFGPGTAPAVDYSYSTGPEGLNELAASFAAPAAAPITAPSYFAPTVGAIPFEVSSFLGPGMSNLQQRAAIGAFGTQGSNSAFRNEQVKRYYASLLAQELVKNRNQLNEAAYLLPIEQQYLSGIIGRPANTPAQAYESIRGLL